MQILEKQKQRTANFNKRNQHNAYTLKKQSKN